MFSWNNRCFKNLVKILDSADLIINTSCKLCVKQKSALYCVDFQSIVKPMSLLLAITCCVLVGGISEQRQLIHFWAYSFQGCNSQELITFSPFTIRLLLSFTFCNRFLFLLREKGFCRFETVHCWPSTCGSV